MDLRAACGRAPHHSYDPAAIGHSVDHTTTGEAERDEPFTDRVAIGVHDQDLEPGNLSITKAR